MTLSEIVKSAIKCRNGLGGHVYKVDNDGFHVTIYTIGGFSIKTDGMSVCNKNNSNMAYVEFDVPCDISPLFKKKEDKESESLSQYSDLTFNSSVAEKGKLTKRNKEDLKRYAEYMKWASK
jgi:hypothetical protein